MKLNFSEAKFRNTVKRYQIVAPDLITENKPGEKHAIEIQKSELKKVPGKIEVLPLSITLYEIEMK